MKRSRTLCQHKDCPREARAAVRTTRPTREKIITTVYWDDDTAPAGGKSEKLCKEHAIDVLSGLGKVLIDEDDI